jgi:hypothetical protein
MPARMPGWEVVGVDFNPAYVAYARTPSPETVFSYLDRMIELALLGLLVITGIIQLGINDRQGKITKRQTEIMERQVKLSEVIERPWVAIEGIQVMLPLTFKDGRADLNVKFVLKNTGHIPATHVLIIGKFFYRSVYGSKELVDVWAECDQFRVAPLEARGSGISIFPEQQPWMFYNAIMVADDVKRIGVLPISGAPTFAGCIDYGWGGDATRHQTRFVYEIDKKGPDGSAIIFSPGDGDIPIADVIVNLNPLLAGNPD